MADKKKQKSGRVWSLRPIHLLATSSALATLALHPIDTIKVRMQMGEGSGLQVVKNMVKNDGIRSFYKGWSTGMLRQAAFTAVVVRTYASTTVIESLANDGKPLSHYQMHSCLLSAGVVGACISIPADLVLVRLQADATLPAGLRRNYANGLHALYRVIADEGVLALMRSASPAVVKSIGISAGFFTATQCFSLLIHNVHPTKASKDLGFCAAFGLLSPLISKPFDYVKTQMLMMKPDATGKYPYSGSIDCAMKTLKLGGPLKLYTGFSAYCITSASYLMLTFALNAQLQRQNISIKVLATDQQ